MTVHQLSVAAVHYVFAYGAASRLSLVRFSSTAWQSLSSAIVESVVCVGVCERLLARVVLVQCCPCPGDKLDQRRAGLLGHWEDSSGTATMSQQTGGGEVFVMYSYSQLNL